MDSWVGGGSAPEDLVTIVVLVEDSSGSAPTVATLNGFINGAEIEYVDVWADTDHVWLTDWGGAGGTNQHAYYVLDEQRVIVWQKNSGTSTSVPELRQAVNEAY